MSCNEWFTLAQRYRNVVKVFCEAVDTWSGLPPGAEFNNAWQLAERAPKTQVSRVPTCCTTNTNIVVY